MPPLSDENREPGAAPATALFALGFRPFFLMALLSAALGIALWIARTRGALEFEAYYGALLWHGHEMVFGFAVAVVAGFLLTAVARWTGIKTPTDGPLALLALLWLAGRLVPFLHPSIPAWAVAIADVAFLPALALVLSVPLLRGGAPRNRIFLVALTGLVLANGLVHAGRLGGQLATSLRGLDLGVDLIVLMIAIISGRVVPYFTERALAGATPRRWPAVEIAAIGSVLAITLLRPFAPPAALLAGIAGVATAAHAVRLAGWQDRRVWATPLLWVLHIGYAWVVIGFALTALAALGRVSPFLALHAFTAGAIGGMTLGMMARVTLGHTGRALLPARGAAIAFALVHLAAAVRVFGPLLAPAHGVALVTLSGVCWIGAFALALAVHAGMLLRPRVDGQPG